MSINRYKAGSDSLRQNPRSHEIPWQMDSSPLYIRRQDHLNDRMRALYVSEPTTPPPPPPVTFTSPTTRQTPLAGRNHHYLQRQDPRNSSDYDNTPPEPPKRTSSASMTASYDSASTSSSSLQYRNGGGGVGYGAGSSSRLNDGLYASPGAPALAPLAVEEDCEANFLMSLENMACTRCGDGFEPHEKIVNSHGEVWHQACFVCCQCFRPFPEGIFYEFEGRKYCEHDFHVLFAPCCGKCGEFIIGRVIKAMNNNWHPQCFRCEICTIPLADQGFIKNAGRALCHECNAKEKAAACGKYICYKCHGIIDDMPLKFRSEPYHPYHFNCTACGVELTAEAREVKGDLYCLRCHDKMGIPICGACRRPIEERVVTALGKNWHVEHFVCAKCEKPFLGHRHYEKKGLAYCETHYHQLFGNLCYICNNVIGGDVFTALNKAWCVHHFACSVCDQKMSQKTKFFEVDLKPVCKRCFEKFPSDLKKRLKKSYEVNSKNNTWQPCA
ncbi:LIM and senescent cell antigen-like-containing domain protein 1 [Dermacentor andersoni]|uniref:LIM and senescent cell antigen-like-containing domain protein 1 n=1 Tax=Dermacentor andersoni TaxID=34620 RepID=UPI0021554893|nr:LIM and senescent cell antigen-like-containing domain protein 1 [Dermacentor andersoni]